MIGTVIKYDRARSFGFILTDDPELPDYFVCAPFILGKQRWLMPNWVVEFTPVETDKGFEAHDVRVITRTIAIQRSLPKPGGVK
jgi:cold shock CspA family protein